MKFYLLPQQIAATSKVLKWFNHICPFYFKFHFFWTLALFFLYVKWKDIDPTHVLQQTALNGDYIVEIGKVTKALIAWDSPCRLLFSPLIYLHSFHVRDFFPPTLATTNKNTKGRYKCNKVLAHWKIFPEKNEKNLRLIIRTHELKKKNKKKLRN